MSHRRTRAAWVIGTGLVAFAAGLTAGRHLDREWRWQGGALERGAPTSTNASRASVPAAGEAKAERASNNPWPDEGKAGVYVVEWRDELAIEDDPTLKERVAVFERSPEVTAARCYAPGPAPTDVYVVWNDADRRSEVHMVKWYSPAGDQGTKFHQVVSLGGPARSAELVFLDVNGDGRKEVITLHAGNAAYLVILDFGRPWQAF